MANLKECPVKGCTRGAKPEHLMCWPHWKRVPKILQRAVWDTFARYSRISKQWGVNDCWEEVVEARGQYEKAAADAIAAVEAKEAA